MVHIHRAVFWKLRKLPKFLVCIFQRSCINFDKNLVWLHFGSLFHKLIWSPLWSTQKTWATSIIFWRLPIVNYWTFGETSLNLVTLFKAGLMPSLRSLSLPALLM
jgi:hypothetical protein